MPGMVVVSEVTAPVTRRVASVRRCFLNCGPDQLIGPDSFISAAVRFRRSMDNYSIEDRTGYFPAY